MALLCGSCDQGAQMVMQDVHQQVVNDAEEQYRMVERSGTAIDKCVRAGLVAEAHLQAKDESSYRTWKAIENLNCANAGVSR